MYEISNLEAPPRRRWRAAGIAAALLGAAVLCQPDSARAQMALPSLGDGFPGGEFNAGEFGGSHGGEVNGWAAGRDYGYDYLYGYVDRDGHGWLVGGSDPDYGYYEERQPSDGHVGSDCSAPAGCYFVLAQCNLAWQTVPRKGTVSQGDKEGVVVGGGPGTWADGGSAGGYAGDFDVRGFGGLDAGSSQRGGLVGFQTGSVDGDGFSGFRAGGFQGP
jgi:hypothetical protein